MVRLKNIYFVMKKNLDFTLIRELLERDNIIYDNKNVKNQVDLGA